MEALLQRGGVTRVADSGPGLGPAGRAPVLRLHVKRDVSAMALGSVSWCMGIGGQNEGGRGGCVKAGGRGGGMSPENGESGAREQALEQAKAESASTIDDEQEPFRDAVESGQTIGEATTEQQFGENDCKGADEAVVHASQELFQQSKMNGKSEPSKGDNPEDEKEEVSSEVWGSKDEEGNTHAFLDDSNRIDFHGEDDESILGIGGQRAGESQM